MRRVAANWVFRSENKIFKHAVVVLSDIYACNYYKIEDDMPPAEWLGGIVFLSSQEEVELPEYVTINQLKSILLSEEFTPRYAYHLIGIEIDFQDSFPSSYLIRLEDDGDY